jgi:Zn finger protein HypA/HybF involved in hydrogenase expression
MPTDMTTQDLMVDGNAVAGLLADLMGADVTMVPAKCAACGEVNAMGALHAYVQAPGSVLRCPICHAVMMRIVQTDRAVRVEMRGIAYLRFER